jgi:hypothetical protein
MLDMTKIFGADTSVQVCAGGMIRLSEYPTHFDAVFLAELRSLGRCDLALCMVLPKSRRGSNGGAVSLPCPFLVLGTVRCTRGLSAGMPTMLSCNMREGVGIV